MLILTQDKKPINQIPHVNVYEIEIEFMVGDADDERYNWFYVPEEKLPELTDELEEALLSIQRCIVLDETGSAGFESTKECIRHYGHIKNWNKFCSNPYSTLTRADYCKFVEDFELDNYSENSKFTYQIPRVDDIYCSYESLTIYYYDSKGTKIKINWESK